MRYKRYWVGTTVRKILMNRDDIELEHALDKARRRYVQTHPASLESAQSAASFMPGGNTRTVLFHEPFPLRIVSGEGCRIRDADGFEYVNLLGEYTAGLFGHSNTIVRDAVMGALDNGVNLSGHCPDEILLAELICSRFPAIDKVRFTNSGTEANLLAIATAIHSTGKRRVLVFNGSYHGGLLYFVNGGMPINAPYDFLLGDYNGTASTRALIRQHAHELACILVEPMQGALGCIPALPEFLEMLRNESRKARAVLVFDEVMTSRLSESGAQGIYKITPDMCTLGKYLGGGLTFGAFGGEEELMGLYDPHRPGSLPHAGTFNNNSLTMAAGVAALGQVLTAERLDSLNILGDRMRDELNGIARRHAIAIRFTGLGSLIGIHATSSLDIDSCRDLADRDDRVLELLFLDMLECGYYLARRGFIALMLTIGQSEADGFVESFERFAVNRKSVLKKTAADGVDNAAV